MINTDAIGPHRNIFPIPVPELDAVKARISTTDHATHDS